MIHQFLGKMMEPSALHLPFEQSVLHQSLPVLGHLLLICLEVCLTARTSFYLLQSLAFSANDMTLIPASSGPSKKCSNSLTSTWVLSPLSMYFSIVSRTTIASSSSNGGFLLVGMAMSVGCAKVCLQVEAALCFPYILPRLY